MYHVDFLGGANHHGLCPKLLNYPSLMIIRVPIENFTSIGGALHVVTVLSPGIPDGIPCISSFLPAG